MPSVLEKHGPLTGGYAMAEGTKILFVDDVADWRKMLSGLLSDHGYEVKAVESREEAQQALKEEPFTLAILDKRLDETDEKNAEGLTLARHISENYPQMTVIILTGYGTQEDVTVAQKPDERGKRLASAFVEKNRLDELPAIIENTLKGK
jgi:DNA-binding NtrC family response regulator